MVKLLERNEDTILIVDSLTKLSDEQRGEIELVFTELNLKGESGFSLFDNESANTFQTIVVSNCFDLAVEAFNYGVLDFIPKPVNQERLKKAIERFSNNVINRIDHPRLLGKNQSESILIELESIQYLATFGNYSKAVLNNSKTELIEKSLSKVSKLTNRNFFQIHQSYIVNLNQVNSVTKDHSSYKCVLKSGVELPVSKYRYDDFLNRISI
ncbi:MAG: response regulator transcription factor [Calditrichaeota bacterium]|nr:response regulator transcription factor [Calditrichota bacterium]